MILIKTEEEIKGVREASKIVAEVFEEISDFIKPGVMLKEIDRKIDKLIRKRGGRPAFYGYRGFPASSCISLNEEVVHGIPDNRVIREGDLVKIDIGVEKRGYYGDAAKTFVIGEIPSRVVELVETAEKALYRGIDAAKPNGRLSDISHAIEEEAKSHGFYVVKELGGHGVGLFLHEDPLIPNYGEPGRGPILKPGMVLAIEPMINMGTSDVKMKGDGWTVITADGSLSAHFEHTIAIGRDGPEILTLMD
jgi:methionyl aminopeptidase